MSRYIPINTVVWLTGTCRGEHAARTAISHAPSSCDSVNLGTNVVECLWFRANLPLRELYTWFARMARRRDSRILFRAKRS